MHGKDNVPRSSETDLETETDLEMVLETGPREKVCMEAGPRSAEADRETGDGHASPGQITSCELQVARRIHGLPEKGAWF